MAEIHDVTSLHRDGGPAFPIAGFPTTGEGTFYALGLTVRDWFAGQALAGMMATGWGEECAKQLNKRNVADAHTLSSFALRIADAMLAERAKAQP